MPETMSLQISNDAEIDAMSGSLGQKHYKADSVGEHLYKMEMISSTPKDQMEDSLKKMPAETAAGASCAPGFVDACGAAHVETSDLHKLKERGSSCAETESSTSVSVAAEASSPQKSSMKSNGGARPKTSSKPKKGVTWSQETSTKTCVNDEEYDQHRNLLLALRTEDGLFNSPGVQAARAMLDTEALESPELFQMTAKMLRVKLNRFPTGQELLKVFMEYSEIQIVAAFIEACQTEEGHSLVKSFLHGDITHVQQSNNSEQPEDIPHKHCDSNVQTLLTEAKPTPVPQKKRDINEMSKLALRREQKYLKDSLTCVMCKERPVEVTLLPCGHFVLCAQCSDTCYVCPVCNKTALGEVKTYLG